MDRTGRQTRWPDIAEAIASDIRAGRLKVGDRIPSTSELVARHGAAWGTVRKALDALKATGTLRGEKGAGVYVAGPAPERIVPLDPMAILEAQIEELRSTREAGGPVPEELLASIRDSITELRTAVAAAENRLDLHEEILRDLFRREGMPFPEAAIGYRASG